ncbi:MAG: hypothetical protein SV375_16375 [Thermodesulfobacteriota bacterium]|nr:hypothetical protein [Thermodesulfobacteriota bacterium]
MKILQRPIRTTIFFGLICGLSFIPLAMILNYFLSWSSSICLTLWLYIAGYSMLLTRWSKKGTASIVFPLMLLFLTVFLVDSISAFFLLALIVMSWIRSGICFKKRAGIGLLIELLICFFGGVLMVLFTPYSAFSWALGFWMFFLVQALYFVFIDVTAVKTGYRGETDTFERAQKCAEDILSTGLHA